MWGGSAAGGDQGVGGLSCWWESECGGSAAGGAQGLGWLWALPALQIGLELWGRGLCSDWPMWAAPIGAQCCHTLLPPCPATALLLPVHRPHQHACHTLACHCTPACLHACQLLPANYSPSVLLLLPVVAPATARRCSCYCLSVLLLLCTV